MGLSTESEKMKLEIRDSMKINQNELIEISGKGLISSTKQFNKGLGIIFPWLSLTNWCIRNFGLKFYVKNIDYFFQLNIEGVFSMIVNIFYNMKKRKKGN